MNQKYFLFAFAFLLFSTLAAQRIVPLEGYDFLAPEGKGRLAEQAKMDCSDLVPDAVDQVTAGDSINLTITIDTSGYGPGGGYRCLNCDELGFGTLVATDRGFTYFSNGDVNQGLDTLELAFCTAAGDSCSSSEQAIVLVQRAPLVFDFPSEVISPQERMEIEVAADQLPGGLFCRTFVDCLDDDYLGNEQATEFLEQLDMSNDFRYTAARYAGVDRVCLRLCNEFGLCDEYNYSFEVVRQNVDLPFFDDFSNESNRPRLALWQNEDVLINRDFAILPPSLGVATFDAVGPTGSPYPNGSNSPVPRDRLTSAGLNMSGAGNATITFYVQPRGLGNRPERGDSLVLEFLRPNGEWRHAWSQPGLSSGEGNCSDRPFIGHRVEIPNGYNYDGFQFRFTNLSDQTGALDHWHLDYVKVSDEFTELNLDDIALVREPPYAITPYSRMPYRQLVAAGAARVQDDFTIAVWNHASPDEFLPATNSNYLVNELTTSTSLLPANTFNGLAEIPMGVPFVISETPNQGIFNNYRDALLNLDNSAGDEEYLLRTTYNLNSQTSSFNEIDAVGFAESVSANNQASRVTVLGDAYAYDDGTAELAVEALPGQTLVQEYEAFTDEVLRGVSIRLPRTTAGNTANLTINLVVFLGDLVDGAEPDFSMPVNPIYVENFFRDSLNGFTSYAFPDSIDIPTGRFYVGWQQTGNCTNCVPVGLDRNNIIEGTRYFRNAGDWFEFSGCSTGALMVRPLVGDSDVPISSVAERGVDAAAPLVRPYPNPARDRVNLRALGDVRLDQVEWTLYDLTGQKLSRGAGTWQVEVNGLAAGVYVLKVQDTQSARQSLHKLIVE